MGIQDIRQLLPEYAKDTKLNLSKVFDEDGIEGLEVNQSFAIALASTYATKNKKLIASVIDEVSSKLSEDEIAAAKGAATIMGMNNVYYRFVHLVSDAEFKKMPAKLRMNIIGKPGVPKVDFELMSLAVSAINGCGMCIDAHVKEVLEGGITRDGVQSTIRIAAIINAAAQALDIEQ